MGRVVALGEEAAVGGYRLAGVLVRAAEDPDAVRRAWLDMTPGTDVVILTPRAAEALRDVLDGAAMPLTVVMT